ncbi:MAG: DEAD/DEAH box helicase family protein [Clostridiales bacterium]|jgi:type I restriction enzyme R subunit|nr:DEAD/DEAH box helicase family protein [Clostridiales bacterium]
MTNFNFLKADPQFASFADTAVQAELVLPISPALSATGCRTALEFAVKWLYSVDKSLTVPYDNNLAALINTDDFKDLLPYGLMVKIDFIRKLGNNAVHSPNSVTADEAMLSLENLHSFMSFVAYCYGTDYKETAFDKSLHKSEKSTKPADVAAPVQAAEQELDFAAMLDENFHVREKLSARRAYQLKQGYTVKPMDFTEDQTRKAYIDVMLQDAGWQRGINWIDEYKIDEMPSKSGYGMADYVLFGDDGLPLAVIEAKRTSVNVEKGRQQAVLYADFLEKKFGRRPVIFLTNGYQTRIWSDKYYPERHVSGIYSKRDIEKEFNKMQNRKPLKGATVNDNISNRYYQKEAIQSVCDTFGERNRRMALLVMATGSGKTRTVISIVDVLERYGWIKNVLFLADRTALVTQAKRAFANLMPNLSLCNLVENKADYSARAVFSTYQTIMNAIDNTRDEKGNRLYTPGHFDLIIVDEAHRSIYNKYKDIFTYFDALLVGLTATPKDQVDSNTYEIFGLEVGVPTYGYELSQAVQDGYLVNYISPEIELKFISQGIAYDELSPEEKEEYENTFADEDGNIPDSIDASALNEWVFNYDTIKKALEALMNYGQRVDYGAKIGKTIIFAKSHNHAEKILEVWNKEFSNYPAHYCRVINNSINYAQSLIDDFSEPQKFPQIAISVDMLDTGIDVPEILNLVFFKKVFSRSKFWQMIGRGTRLCPGIIDGEDKKQFYIFDICGNFAFFRMGAKGIEIRTAATLHERMFNTKTEMAYKLQELTFQTDEFKNYRMELVLDLIAKIKLLNRDNFAVKQHLCVIDKFQNEGDFETLTYENTLQIAEHIAPLIPPLQDEISTVRFDILIYQIELAMVAAKSYKRAKNDLIKKAQELSKYATIPEIAQQSELINQILNNSYLERAGVLDYENIRIKLRSLIKYIPYDERARYDTNFTDDVISIEWNESQLDNDDLANYKKKVSSFITQNQNIPVIAKLKGNLPLTPSDIDSLEDILWGELGTKQQYDAQYGKTPLGELVRSIVGLSQKAANDAFSEFLNDAALDSRQMHFVKQIVNYIVKNGMMKDLAILQESPFSDSGRISEIFGDTNVFIKLRTVIDGINSNAAAA